MLIELLTETDRQRLTDNGFLLREWEWAYGQQLQFLTDFIYPLGTESGRINVAQWVCWLDSLEPKFALVTPPMLVPGPPPKFTFETISMAIDFMLFLRSKWSDLKSLNGEAQYHAVYELYEIYQQPNA